MILTTEYKGRNVLILGFGTSGESLAASLSTSGAIVWIWDDNPNTLLKAKKIGFNTFNPYEDEIWNIIDLLLVSPGISTSGSSSHELVIKARFLGIMIDNDIGLFFKLLKSSRDTFNVRPKVVAVTGSNGKSTTASLIHHILLYAGVKTQFGGNIGKSVFDLTPLKNEEIIVLELSSYQLESANSLSPDIAVFTNFSPDHLERHGGVQGYFEAKKRLFQDGLPSISIINTDSLEGQKLRSDVLGESIEICSGCTDIQKGWIVQNSNQTLIEYKNGIKKFSFNLKKFENLPGSHNHENIGLAYATCIGIGVEKNKIMEALETFVGLPPVSYTHLTLPTKA